MFVNIQIPDEIYQVYAERKPERPQVALADTIKQFVKEVPGENRVILNDEQVRRLNGVIGHPVQDAEDLIKSVKQFGQLSVEGMEVEIPGELRVRFAAQATFYAPTNPEEYKKLIAERVVRALWGMV